MTGLFLQAQPLTTFRGIRPAAKGQKLSGETQYLLTSLRFTQPHPTLQRGPRPPWWSKVPTALKYLLQIAKHAKSEKTTQDTQAVLPGTSGLWLLTT